MSTTWLHLVCVAGLVRSHSLCIVSSLLCLLSLILFIFTSNRKVKDTLPLFRQFFSSAFSLTYVSLASMKLPPDVLRYSPHRLLSSIQICSLLSKLLSREGRFEAYGYPQLSRPASYCFLSLSFLCHSLLFFLSPQGSLNRVNLQSSYQRPSSGHQWLWGKSSSLHLQWILSSC